MVGLDAYVVPFKDGISFEVVPAFVNKDDSFTYPDANNGGSWRTTNPRPEIESMREQNNICNGNLVSLCRMAREWKRNWNVPISGLLIDTLAYQFISTWQYRGQSYTYYDYMCRDFFKWMADQNPQQEYWRAPGSSQYVYDKGPFQYKAKLCYNISLEAIECETATPKLERWAKQKWRKIFGNKYPE